MPLTRGNEFLVNDIAIGRIIGARDRIEREGGVGAGISRFEIMRDLRREYGEMGWWDERAVRGVVDRAWNGTQGARQMNDDPDLVLGRSQHPISPHVGPDQELYEYRVRVRWINDQGTVEYSTTTVRSDERLSSAAIRESLNDRIAWDEYPDDARAGRIQAAIGSDAFTIEILSVGRRGT